MAFDLRAVREGLAAALAVTDLNVYTAGEPQPTLPAAVFTWPVDIMYDVDVGGCGADLSGAVTVVVGHGDPEVSIAALDRYVAQKGPESVVDALDGQLGPWQSCRVVRAANWRPADDGFAVDIEIVIRT
jgi:hypothetical protein